MRLVGLRPRSSKPAIGSQTIPRCERSVEATARPVHRPFRTNSLGRVTRHWRVWLISEVASRQAPVAHDKVRGPVLAGHDGCPTGIDKVVAGALTKKRRWWLARKRSHVLNGRLETTVRPVHRPFRTNPLARVTRHWRVWLISEVASRQVPVAHDKGRGPLLAGHDGCPTGIDKVVAGALTKKRRWWLARKRSHVLKGRLETTLRPVHRPFRTNSLGRVTRHWRVWLGERFHQCCSAAPRPNGEGSF